MYKIKGILEKWVNAAFNLARILLICYQRLAKSQVQYGFWLGPRTNYANNNLVLFSNIRSLTGYREWGSFFFLFRPKVFSYSIGRDIGLAVSPDLSIFNPLYPVVVGAEKLKVFLRCPCFDYPSVHGTAFETMEFSFRLAVYVIHL